MKYFSNSVFSLVLLLLVPLVLHTQLHAQWNGKHCAVALTYDDALPEHCTGVVPLLDSVGFRATFYIPVSFPDFQRNVDKWKRIATTGHELGNHTVFHPCDGSLPGREWVPAEYRLDFYSVRRMCDEIEMANFVLTSIDGKKMRTFAYTCGDQFAGKMSFVDCVRKLFPAARGVGGEGVKMNEIDLLNIPCVIVNGQSGEELISYVQKAIRNEHLIVFLFHGVGGTHPYNCSEEAHRKLVSFLQERRDSVWVAPLIDIAQYVKQHQSTH